MSVSQTWIMQSGILLRRLCPVDGVAFLINNLPIASAG